MKKVSVILPCRNEEKNIKKTLNHLQNQTIKPNEIVIVDDASTDKTFEILQEFAAKNPCQIKKREKNDERYISIVNSLKIASSLLKKDFDYLLVLDGDTLLEEKYIEKLLKKFGLNSNLGIAGGSLKSPNESDMNPFWKYDFNIFGSNRIYSKKCWYDINKGKTMKAETVTWDTEHAMLAEGMGYLIKRFDEISSESIRSTSNKLPSFMRGVVFYQFGYGFLFTFISALIKLKFKYLLGYIDAWIDYKEKIGNKKIRKKIKTLNNRRSLLRIKSIFKF